LATAARTEYLASVIAFVRNGALEARLPEARLDEVDLLVEETFLNVCSYAYPEGTPGGVTVTYSVPVPGELSVEVADQGAAFNPLTVAHPDLGLNLEHLPIGGMGLRLVKALAKSLTYRREGGWNRLKFGISAGS
jgi:anti-sigma regulatory factor (Ser/Thr protein kinase)